MRLNLCWKPCAGSPVRREIISPFCTAADDGYSGVDFSNRPGFQKMLAEIEAGHVEVVITKDLSRLGRNSSLTGLYINYTFPQYGVRYIAINDHFDTIDPNSTDSDMAGIKNWFNQILYESKIILKKRHQAIWD